LFARRRQKNDRRNADSGLAGTRRLSAHSP
jgi:hypothetical protein